MFTRLTVLAASAAFAFPMAFLQEYTIKRSNTAFLHPITVNNANVKSQVTRTGDRPYGYSIQSKLARSMAYYR